ncbi:hypothetical protein IAU60_005360 [Kwoniella sp. DSM 27419]
MSSSIAPVSSPPLGPMSSLPSEVEGLKNLRILLLVSSVNSFTQRVYSYLQYLDFEQVSVQLATSDEAMIAAAEQWKPDLILCPFLTKKIPASVHNRWITLVVHPGPPGDAGPSSLDWMMLGDDGSITDSTKALDALMASSDVRGRTHWGTICFQATEEMDGGAVWAFEQYALPPIGSFTKAQVYQSYHSPAAMTAVIHALCRVYERTVGLDLPHAEWTNAMPKPEWSARCVSLDQPFLGGSTCDRPLLSSAKRRPDWTVHTAEDVRRILNAGDSQPGAMLHPLTSDSKSSLFAYGAHVHQRLSAIPANLYTSLGYTHWDAVPDGKIIATRDGAVFIKTHQTWSSAAGIWITHGRVPRGKDKPIDPKIPMVDAIRAAGHGAALVGVKEWSQDTWMEKPGEWQEVCVKTVQTDQGKAQLVYWNFYNGAFSTENCQTLLRALQWATAEERGQVKVLALMGGNYFCNGIALNTIENAACPRTETWANINAIDDLVSFLVGDTSEEVPTFLEGVKPLAARRIVTVACVRGNAAAGGVALATACDVVLASRGAVLNPSYRAMGLHGSELHSYSYMQRCGKVHAASILREMKPIHSALALSFGLIDMEIGTASVTPVESEPLCVDTVRLLVTLTTSELSEGAVRCAPWCSPNVLNDATIPAEPTALTSFMCANKLATYANRDFPPLQHYRNKELSQMLLDCFHPVRSQRYHSRRYKFVRKVKATVTPARYMLHGTDRVRDEEDTKEFDDAPGWVRGEEWSWVGMNAPQSLETSEKTRVDMLYGEIVKPEDVSAEHTNRDLDDGVVYLHKVGDPLENGAAETAQEAQEEAGSETPPRCPAELSIRMSPSTSSSRSMRSTTDEGPITPATVPSPGERLIVLPATYDAGLDKKNHNEESADPCNGADAKAKPSPAQGYAQTVTNTRAVPGSSNSQARIPASGSRYDQGISNKDYDHVDALARANAHSRAKTSGGGGAFKSFRKKVKSALRSLGGDHAGPSPSPAPAVKSAKQASIRLNLATPAPSTMTVSISAQASETSGSPIDASTRTRRISMVKAKGGSGPPIPSRIPITPIDTPTTAQIPNAGQTTQRDGECEWPCLVTGGEENYHAI